MTNRKTDSQIYFTIDVYIVKKNALYTRQVCIRGRVTQFKQQQKTTNKKQQQ